MRNFISRLATKIINGNRDLKSIEYILESNLTVSTEVGTLYSDVINEEGLKCIEVYHGDPYREDMLVLRTTIDEENKTIFTESFSENSDEPVVTELKVGEQNV